MSGTLADKYRTEAARADAAYPAAALDAVREIKLLQSMVRHVAQFAEARLMEKLWDIHRAIPDEGAFREFIAGHLTLPPDEALRYALTWDSARENKALRELAHTAPNDALRLVNDLAVDAGDSPPEVDPEVTRILSLPARRRHEAIRDLVDAQQGHHPADKEQIRSLTAERDELLAQREHPLTTRARKVSEMVLEMEALAGAARHEVNALKHTEQAEIPPGARIETGYILTQVDKVVYALNDLAGDCQTLLGDE